MTDHHEDPESGEVNGKGVVPSSFSPPVAFSHLARPASADSPPPPEHVRKTDLLAALLYGGGIFAAVHALAILSISAVTLYRTMGVYSTLMDFDLPRFLTISLLPFCFNLIFGVFFGQKYWAYGRWKIPSSRAEAPWPRYWIRNPWLGVFLVWLLLFNLPRFLNNAPVLEALRNFSVPPWPPGSYYLPIRNEVFLYMAVGNRALWAGFLATVGWLWFSSRIASQDALESPHQEVNPEGNQDEETQTTEKDAG